MASRKGGLGPKGGEALGRIPSTLGNPVGSNRYEEVMFGGGRPGGPAQPPTDWRYPNSSRVAAYQYDYNTQQLRVRFIKYGTPWVYNSVPRTVFEAFDTAPSKGQFINTTLNNYPYGEASGYDLQAFQGV